MTLTRKGSRRVRVGDTEFLWRIRPRPTYRQSVENGTMTVAIQFQGGGGNARRALHLQLRVRPPEVTRREASTAADLPEAERTEWVSHHAEARSLPRVSVWRALLVEACHVYEHRQHAIRAADLQSDTDEAVRHAASALRLIDHGLVQLTADGALDVGILRAVWETTSANAGWDTRSYATLRALEDDLLDRVAADENVSAALVLEALRPWAFRAPGHPPRSTTRYRKLVRAAVAAISRRVPALLAEPERIAIALTTDDDRALQHVLVGPETVVWTEPLRSEVLRALADPRTTSSALELISTLGSIERYGIRIAPEWLEPIRADADLVLALWLAATRSPLQPNRTGVLAANRAVLNRWRQTPLPIPEWWADAEEGLVPAAPDHLDE